MRLDTDLINRSMRRDPDAFADLMRTQMSCMYKVARQILHTDEDIADAAQETILTCWEKLDQVRDAHAFRSWMMRILINNCYDQIRGRGPVTYTNEPPETQVYEGGFEQAEWQALLGRIDERYRMVLILYYLEGFRTGEIAKILDIPESTVRTRLKRGREKLAQEYQGRNVI